MILFRSVGLQELELIYDSGMKAFPARLSQQPIFYPVLQLDYARQIASDWNTSREQSAGYVTQFKVDDDYIDEFEIHTVGVSEYEELWIPAEQLDEFNRHITGQIKVVEAYFGERFEGFVPDAFGMQGKNAIEQFTWLANTFIYKRLDFYLEIKRNHKAVFLNYPFWLRHDFKNPGLKEKVVKAIREGWLASFPQIPLMSPVQEAITPTRGPDSNSSVQAVEAESTPAKQSASRVTMKPLHKINVPVQLPEPDSDEDSVDEDINPIEPPPPTSVVLPISDDSPPFQPSEQAVKQPAERPLKQPPGQPLRIHPAVQSAHEDHTPLAKLPDAYFEAGIKAGLSGNYQEAIDALCKVVEDHPNDRVAQTSLGVAFHRLGEDDRARACYEIALHIEPNDAEAHYFRANIFYSQGNIREAISEYTVALGLEPALIDAHQDSTPEDRLTDYTRSPSEMHRIARAAHRILRLNRLLEANSRQASLFKERAAEYSRLWNYEQAIADYSSYLKLQPDDASALHLRGVAYEQVGQPERALQDYQRAIAIDPHLADVYINRGINLGKTGNFRQSVASLTEGIRLAPQNPNGYFNRGMSNLQQGELESAIDDFSNAIRLSPGEEDAYYWRGVASEEAGHQPEATADYRQFLALSQNPQARADVERKLSQWNEGGEKTDRVEAQDSDHDADLHRLILALGDRALHSTWFGSGVDCHGEKAEELHALTDQNNPIDGRDLLDITSGIRQTIAGDFQAFDSGAPSPWIFIRAWEGNGFYVETNDARITERLKSHFQSVEEVQGANAPYEGILIRF